MRGLLGALQFLTRVPIRLSGRVPYGEVLPWFPVVGLLIGAACGAVMVGAGYLVPLPVAACLAVITGLLITGAFHEDGLADIADAFGGGWDVEERLRILKDSRQGTYGVAALASSILTRVLCLATITSPAAAFGSLIAAHTVGRTVAVIGLRLVPAARNSGLGSTTSMGIGTGALVACAVSGIAITAAVTGWWAAPFVVCGAVALAVVGWLAVRKIGGQVGDVLGAVEQVTECLVLIVATGLASRWPVWWET